MTKISVTEEESAALLELSGPAGEYVPMAFGLSGLCLDTKDPDARWALNTLAVMRQEARDLPGQLNHAVETAVHDTLQGQLVKRFADVKRADALDRHAREITQVVTTAVFLAMQDAGFNIVRKAG